MGASEILWRSLAPGLREMISSKRWFPRGKSREPFKVKLLVMVWLAANKRFPDLR